MSSFDFERSLFLRVTVQLGQPFDHEDKLVAATKRQQEIITALDITKNQAPAALAAGEQPAEPVGQHSQSAARPHGRNELNLAA